MTIQDLQKLYAHLPQVKALSKVLERKSAEPVSLRGFLASSAPLFFSSLALKCRRTMLFVLQDAEEAGYFYHDLSQAMGADSGSVLFFPSSFRRAVKYGQRDAANEILRTEVLSQLSAKSQEQGDDSLYIVTYPDAVAELVVTRKNLADNTLVLTTGQTVSVSAIMHQLRELGFKEVDYVYEPGQFALRGSILDVFSFSHEYPFRIDFFGDDIDSIRTFEVEDQLSKERRDHADIVSEMSSVQEREPLLTFLPDDTVLVFRDYDFVLQSVERICREGFSAQALHEQAESPVEPGDLLTTGERFGELTSRFRRLELRPSATPSGTCIELHVSAQPLFHKNFDLLCKTLSDYKSKDYKVYVLADSKKQIERLREILESAPLSAVPEESANALGAFIPVDKTLHEGFIDHDLRLCLFTDHQIFDRFHKYNLKSDKARNGKVALTLKELQQFEIGDYVVHLDYGIGKFGGLVRMPIQKQTHPQPLPAGRGGVSSSSGSVGSKSGNKGTQGVSSPLSQGKATGSRAMLGNGDGGDSSSAFQEMIKIIYQRGDAIYVSIHSLYKVSKYKGQDNSQPPRMSTLGTGQWERMKERTKQHIKDIARDLIRLYASRRHQKGFAFSRDTYLQHELEASFLYEDTPDQLRATQEVKADMEQPKPMDRLVCGDVGFGKTEVAVRAAFKAACDGKQVAVLVPTTVLAYQHFHTFSRRLKDMPVRVDYLTRARTAKQTTALLSDLAEGKIDILIGTHKLIGKNVKFRDLGLLIIDEEQKFGVSAKEKLRQLRTNVDTLTMSATPIPRTLQFSLVGARDLSVIQTPPPNRYPIQTEIHTFSAEIVADAINFEMSRNGQVFFVNNRISDLQHLKEMILKYVPDCRVAVGHGSMKPDELEQIILDFANYDYDVLLSTTIVENGIDIPNANTIIINSAQNFGLSDLHQMRGRVGRGNRKAFCYLLAPPLSALPDDARRRLEALENFSDLGSGISIAMQDLDIRGAGNLLGAEQSGFISDLGYETYQKILNEAMVELRSERETLPQPLPAGRGGDTSSSGNKGMQAICPPPSRQGEGLYVADCTLESDLEMYFPDLYVPSDSERMLLYRELDNTRNDRELQAYRQRLIDRFGPLPPQAEELLNVVTIRRLGKSLGCEKIMLKQGSMYLYFVSNADSPFYQGETFGRIIDFATSNARRCSMREQGGRRSMVIGQVSSVAEGVSVLQNI